MSVINQAGEKSIMAWMRLRVVEKLLRIMMQFYLDSFYWSSYPLPIRKCLFLTGNENYFVKNEFSKADA